jgi:carboxymethylenebutenolidase
MTRKTAHDFDQELLILFDAYVHGDIDRRAFLDRAAKFAVGGVTAAMLLDQLSPKFLEAQVVSPDDARIEQEYVEFDSPDGYGRGRGYVVKPVGAAGPFPGILVIHENRGLNPHIEDITRRLALDNFVAFAPDALFPLGGYPGTEDDARQLFRQLDQAKTREDFVAAVTFLRQRPECTGRIGAVGFCYGGGMVNYLATRLGTDLRARTTRGSTRAGPTTRAHCRRRESTISATSIPARSTGSTTTRRHGTMRRRPGWPGSERSRSSTNTSVRSRT